MTDAETAFAEAERRIADAKATGATYLNLSGPHFDHTYPRLLSNGDNLKALVRLPDSLADLTGLKKLSLFETKVVDLAPLAKISGLATLDLSGTPVYNLAPLAKLPALERLFLTDTQVADLRPLGDLTRFLRATENGRYGLVYRDTPLTRLDPRFDEISKIDDPKERNRRTKALVDSLGPDWPPAPDIPADRPDAPHYAVDADGTVRSTETLPTGWDEDQRALQRDLVAKSAALADATQTRNERELVTLRQQAAAYRRIVSRKDDDLPLRRLWSAANALRHAYESGAAARAQGRDMETLPPFIDGLLRDLVETHALFIMGFPEAREMEARIRGYLDGRRDPDRQAAARDLAASLSGDGILAPEDQAALDTDLATAGGDGLSAEMAEKVAHDRLSNILLAIGRSGWALVAGCVTFAAGAATAGVVGNAAYAWLVTNREAALTFLGSLGPETAYWVPRVVEGLKVVLGL